mmetsp:Transcript_23919/g.49849  ORF Transcript_23919/g.49849 Transcript_23919/m.49849 type:complete len:211 (-) Transcript_23919:439-1071(-)
MLSSSVTSAPLPPNPAELPFLPTFFGASKLIAGLLADARKRSFSTVKFIAFASSSSVGALPRLLFSSRVVFFIAFSWSWTWTGRRMVRDWSAMARIMDCFIHHVAYVERRKPLSGSNFSVAFISPNVPSWHKSWKLSPLCWYLLAMLTTRRRLDSIMARLAFLDLRICFLSVGTSITEGRRGGKLGSTPSSKSISSFSFLLMLILSTHSK